MNRDNNPDRGDDGAQAEAALTRGTPSLGETQAEAAQEQNIDDLAYRFWSVHPRELDAMADDLPPMPKGYKGGMRAWFFACEMKKLFAALSRPIAPGEVDGLVAETEARLDAFIRPERTVIEKLLASIRSLAAKCAELEKQLSKATDPEYLAGALDKIGVVDAEWRARAEAAEAENASLRARLGEFEEACGCPTFEHCTGECAPYLRPPSDVAVERETEAVTLEECPIGLFYCGDELCLKTEYGNNEGRIDAYIVSSGEFFWGGAKNIAEQREVLVRRAAAKQEGNSDA